MCGKTKLTRIDKQVISQLLDYLDQRPIERHLRKLEELAWIRENKKTGMTLILSIGKINYTGKGISRASVKCRISEISNIYGFVGAAIYSYLYFDFWRRVKSKRVVCLKGRTYHALSSSFNYRNKYAPIALLGVQKIFNLSTKKAANLKQAAREQGYIKVKKTYGQLKLTKSEKNLKMKYDYHEKERFVYVKNSYQTQEIDHILPLLDLYKRKKQ